MTNEEAIAAVEKMPPLGKCCKAMWYGYGAPAGHCDEPAWSGQIKGRFTEWDPEQRREVELYGGHPWCCPKHGGLTEKEAVSAALARARTP